MMRRPSHKLLLREHDGKTMGLTLNYLDFDYSEDTLGAGTFDAVASVRSEKVDAVRAEIAQVLDWAHSAFPALRAPLDEGGEWDFNLHGLREWTALETMDYDEKTRQFAVQLGPSAPPRHTVTLSLSGSPQFCAAFRQRFDPA